MVRTHLSQDLGGGAGTVPAAAFLGAVTELPFVKLAEFGLVFLLAVHMFGGLRLMALEWLPWPAPHKTLAAGTLALSAFLSGIFFLQAI